ncbi:hypothetical protein WL1483_2160 [Aeromonas schubertii]|uniref:Uncharacterized protein n=1 Tax=Aeromonas schubertii TaxID=652 RepID=A0A0S2SIR6_9GAMM|nr:hypothetical protein WL1483_2160 [Aeromonas schubertii]
MGCVLTIDYPDGLCRTGGHTGATTGTIGHGQSGNGNAARGGAKTDGAWFARVLAGLAEDLTEGQTPLIDAGDQLPWSLFTGKKQGFIAGIDAGTTEGAFAMLKIEGGETAVPLNDDPFGTGSEAITATAAAGDEVAPWYCPWQG